jgi:hypothetical protein
MDLLGGYGSDSSSASSAVEAETSSLPRSGLTAAVHFQGATTRTGLIIQGTPTVALPLPQVESSTSKRSAEATSSKAPFALGGENLQIKRKKQRRKLLSLNAVLPPDIVERLTRRQVQGEENGNESSDDDSTDDDNDNQKGKSKAQKRLDAKSHNSKAIKTNMNQAKKQQYAAKSKEISSFLQELGSAKVLGKSTILIPAGTSDRVLHQDQNVTPLAVVSQVAPAKEKPGMAFMAVATEVTSRRKRDSNTTEAPAVPVVDIHNHKRLSPVTSPNPPKVNPHNEVNVNTHGKESVSDVSKELPSLLELESSGNNKESQGKTPMAIMNLPSKSFPSIRRPISATTIRAAPSQPQSAPSALSDSYIDPLTEPEPPHTQTNVSARQRRKEMERALRQGDTSQFFAANNVSQTHNNVVTLDQPAVSSFDLNAGEHAQHVMANQLRGKSHNVAVKMYDPKAGQAVDTKGEVTSQHKQRHHINQLAASAYSLEASLLTTKTKSSNKRVDAKRKYGW